MYYLLWEGVKLGGLMRAIAIGMITAVFCMSAQATLIVAEPDDFALGAELTSAFSGVTLSVEGKPSSVVRAVDGFSAFNSGNIASTGSLVFGQDPIASSVVPQGWERFAWSIAIGFLFGNRFRSNRHDL